MRKMSEKMKPTTGRKGRPVVGIAYSRVTTGMTMGLRLVFLNR